jgi:hypothetical protein
VGTRRLIVERKRLLPLSVPSAIVPETFNALLNPAHQDAKRIVIVQTGEHAIDRRLLK